MLKLFWAGLALLCLGLSSNVRAENQFRMRLVSDPTTFDWNLAHTDVETPIMMNIMEGLVEFDSKMRVKPLLAKSWTVSSDQKTYTFQVRSDVKWSDGKPLSANDFVYSWKRLLTPLTAARYAYMLFDIEGAEDFNSRKISDFSKVGIKAVGPSTLEVRLRKPVAYFLQMLTFWITFPVRQDLVEKHGASWAQPGKTVVLGPFIPTSYQPQSQILLRRNDNYHGKKPQSESILLRIVNEDSTALNLFRSGKLDYVRPVNFLELADLKDSPMFHTAPYFRTCFLNINTSKYPFNLPKVRKAFAMAVDRSKLSDVLHRKVTAADSLMPEALLQQGRGSALEFNSAEAKKLLSEAVGDPKSLPPVEINTFASDENALFGQFLQNELKKNLGIAVSLNMPEFGMYRNRMELGSGSIFYRCWAADYADPDTFFALFMSGSGNSFTGWKNDRYDELVRLAAATPNGPERTKLYKEGLELLLRKEAVIIPLYYDTLTYLLSPRVKNFVINPLNYVFIRDITFTN